MNDEQLVQQVMNGNREAFRLLIVRYQRPVFRFLGLLGFTQATVEDIAQETFLRAFRALATFDAHQGRFSTWLFTIAKRLAANERQRKSRNEQPWSESIPEPLSELTDPAEQARDVERTRRVRTAINALEEPMRSTFIFAQLHELRLDEVAALQGCAVGTVKSRVHRAREILRAALTDEEF
jgi:RNA polymerase sigma-70 factor (ECF subfamily)